MPDADGQVSTGPQTTNSGPETTGATPESQSTGQQTTNNGPGAAEEAFFDPESIKDKPELMSAYKQMQAAFTKRTSALKGSEQKVKAYDDFVANPAQTLQMLAAQYGYQLSRAQAQGMIDGQQQSQFEPQSWEEVLRAAEERAEKRVIDRLSPFINQVKETRQNQVERLLDDQCPDWRVYEDKMTAMLQKHPTMVNDPVELYRISVPAEVWQSRAAQAALKKLQDKASSSQLSGGSTTTQQASDKPKGRMNFDEAVKYAKGVLADRGIHPPTNH